MQRRDFLGVLGGAVAWPIAARAQQSPMPVVGFLNSESPDMYAAMVKAFSYGLNEAGFIEGQNVAIEYRWANGQNDKLPAMAADLIGRQVTVIAANTSATLAARAATTTIPIVFSTSSDPVALGFVASLNRPGGNVTGVSNLNIQLAPKRLEVMHEFVPTAKIIALLVNPANPTVTEIELKSVQGAAHVLGLQIVVLNASSENDFGAAFATLVQQRASALVISAEASFTNPTEILTLAAHYKIPTIYPNRDVPAAGGLISYATSVTDMYRLVGVQTGRILKGDKPADLPVQQSTKVELVINLKTAKALGLTIPVTLLARADEMIE
jgi:putative tryptophan/tyrosine transport system substrate-binding protein